MSLQGVGLVHWIHGGGTVLKFTLQTLTFTFSLVCIGRTKTDSEFSVEISVLVYTELKLVVLENFCMSVCT